MSNLAHELARTKCGDHLCLVYDSPEQQFAAAVPFIADGLRCGEKCVYFADDRTVEEVREALVAAGLDVDGACARGQLHLVTKRDAYLRTGSFVPDEMIAFLLSEVAAGLKAGFSGLCIAGEMTWALGPETGCDRLIEYEARLNEVFPGSRVRAICQYNRRRFSPELIRDVLRTHPIAVLGDEVCPNVFYEPPEMVLGRRTTDDRVDWMIGQLRRARQNERYLEEAKTRAEQEAATEHERQRWFCSLLDLAPVPMVLVDPDSMETRFTNRAAQKLGGGTLPTIHGESHWLSLEPEGAPLAAAEVPMRRAARGERVQGLELAWHTPVGLRSILLSAERLPGLPGRRDLVVVAFEDVSRLKANERELREAVRVRDAFLTVASHELKTPLTSLQLRVQPLVRAAKALAQDPQRLEQQLKGVQGQVERLSRLVDSLLDRSRLEDGHADWHFAELDLAELVRDALGRFEYDARASATTLVPELPQALVGEWDRRALEHVVMNVLSNAVKYGAGKPVTVRLEQVGDAARLTIRDRGFGIAESDHDRIFQRFERAVSERHYSGFGLGLWIAREMVEAMRGHIRVDSHPGDGATFVVELPLAARREADATPEQAAG